MTDKTPIYMYSAAYAREHNELPEYQASHKANVACRDAIDAAIRKYYSNDSLSEEAVHEVVGKFGFERTLYVLANTIQNKDWDGRFSAGNRSWAEAYPVAMDVNPRGENWTLDFIAHSHSGLLDLFTRMTRDEYALTQQQSQGPQMSSM